MKSLELKMFKKKGTSDEQELVFNATDISEDEGTMIVVNMFKAFGVDDPMMITRLDPPLPLQYMHGISEAAATAVPEYIPCNLGPIVRETPTGQKMIDDIAISDDKEAKLKAKQASDVARAKQLPLQGASQPTTYALADDPKLAKMLETAAEIVERTPGAQAAIDNIPSHVKTGVKIKEIQGMPTQTFRCRCNCKCGWRNNRYILPSDSYAVCYDCGTKLAVIPATNRAMIPDEWNNFFVANEEYIDTRGGSYVRQEESTSQLG